MSFVDAAWPDFGSCVHLVRTAVFFSQALVVLSCSLIKKIRSGGEAFAAELVSAWKGLWFETAFLAESVICTPYAWLFYAIAKKRLIIITFVNTFRI